MFRLKPGPDVIGAGYRFAEKNMRQHKNHRAASEELPPRLPPDHGDVVQAKIPSPCGGRPSSAPNRRKCSSGLMPAAATSGFAAR